MAGDRIIPTCKLLLFASVLSSVAAPAAAAPGDLSAYLKARAADADGRTDLAVASYARALAEAPDNPVVALRAYREALEGGDMALASRAGTALTAAGVAPADVGLIAIADAARGDDRAAAEAAIDRLAGTPLAVLVPSLRGWLAFARGEDPAPLLEVSGRDALARRFAAENRALLLIAGGRTEDGLAAVEALRGTGSSTDLRMNAAALLFGSGHPAQGTALLAGDDPALVALRSRQIGARPTLAFGVSRLLTRVAADLASGNPSPLSVALTRSALLAEPGNDRARLLLADALSRGGAHDHALATLAAIPADSPLGGSAASGRVAILAAAGREAEALSAAEVRATAPSAAVADWQRYADLLIAANRYGEAATWYRRIVEAGNGEDWAEWLQLGGALDRAGRWAEAEPALVRAATLAPAQPLALNYLGYARVERGKDVADAARMLERASALAPDNASVTDSLGWAYYLGGDVARALPLLERAAAGEPANTTIGEHLGDAYWSLGRRYEARYAWRAAALTADAGEAPRIAAKIANGLTDKRR